MRKGHLNRLTAKSGDAGTFSNLLIMSKTDPEVVVLQQVAGELPARGNQHGVSCIAPMPGESAITYLLRFQWSQAHGCKKYTVINGMSSDGAIWPIPGGRVASEIHAANLMGDIFKALAAQLEGCIAPGLAFATFPAGQEFHTFTAASPTKLVLVQLGQAQMGVSASGTALAALEKELAGEDLALTVAWI